LVNVRSAGMRAQRRWGFGPCPSRRANRQLSGRQARRPEELGLLPPRAEILPPEVIRDALVKALDLRPSDVRRSRAAYFTSIIMPHLRRCEPKA
jgi:hypothetical protein